MLEELLRQENLLLITLFASVVFIIKELTSVITEWIKKELLFRQRSNHSKKQVQLDLELGLLRKKQEVNIILENKKLEVNPHDLLTDNIYVFDILQEIREYFNARTVTIWVFHNGVAKNFKNFSIRYEETRSIADRRINEFQSKPLSPYYTTVKKFEKDNLLVYDNSDLVVNDNKTLIGLTRDLGLDKLLITPLLVENDVDIPMEHKSISIDKKHGSYYLLGILMLGLDEHSKEVDFETAQSIVLRKVDDIINIYERNQKVLS